MEFYQPCDIHQRFVRSVHSALRNVLGRAGQGVLPPSYLHLDDVDLTLNVSLTLDADGVPIILPPTKSLVPPTRFQNPNPDPRTITLHLTLTNIVGIRDLVEE